MTRWILLTALLSSETALLVSQSQAASPRIPPFDRRVQRNQRGQPPPPIDGEDDDNNEVSPILSQDAYEGPPIDYYDEDYGVPDQPPPPPPFSWPQQQQQDPQQDPLQQPQTPPPPQQQQHPLQRNVATSERIPIHYQFRNKRAAASAYLPPSKDDDDDVDYLPPVTSGMDDLENLPLDEDEEGPSFASPRKDAVTSYLASTSMGRYKLMMSSGIVGAAAGAFVGKSLFSSRTIIQQCILLWSVLFLIGTALRNPYGELVRALGLALIYTVQETKTIRQRYPVGWQRLRLAISFFTKDTTRPLAQRRQPFPKRPEDFSRVYALIAMALIGSICGSNIPIIPSWLGAMIAAVGMAFSTTLPDARGDLARIMAMRVVALTRELWQIQQELEIVPKVGVVSGLVLDKIMILDRQHRIKEKVGSILTLVYTQIARVVQQSQQQGQQGPSPSRNDGPMDSFAFGDGGGRSRRRDGPPPSRDNWGRPRGNDFDDRPPGKRPEWDPKRAPPPTREPPPQQQQRGRSQPPISPQQQQQQQPRERQRGDRGRF